MSKPLQKDWARIQMEFNMWEGGSLKDFCVEKGHNYDVARHKIRAKEREGFQREVMEGARDSLVTSLSSEIAKRLEKHWKITEIIEAQILTKLQEGATEAKSLEQLLRVLQENVRLQRLILGEPDMITQEGPKTPMEAFLAKQASKKADDIEEAEVDEQGSS